MWHQFVNAPRHDHPHMDYRFLQHQQQWLSIINRMAEKWLCSMTFIVPLLSRIKMQRFLKTGGNLHSFRSLIITIQHDWVQREESKKWNRIGYNWDLRRLNFAWIASSLTWDFLNFSTLCTFQKYVNYDIIHSLMMNSCKTVRICIANQNLLVWSYM